MKLKENTLNFEKIATKLQQRLAENTARLEADLAVQASQYEEVIEELQARVQELEAASEGTEVDAEADATPAKAKAAKSS